MKLEIMPCNQCYMRGIDFQVDPSLKPIIESPKVYTFSLKTDLNTVFKIVQIGKEYIFNDQPVQVEVIKNEVVVFNQLISVDSIEQMERTDQLYVFIMNIYKPWLEKASTRDAILKEESKCRVQKFNQIADATIAQADNSLTETRIALAKTNAQLAQSRETLVRTEEIQTQFDELMNQTDKVIAQFAENNPQVNQFPTFRAELDKPRHQSKIEGLNRISRQIGVLIIDNYQSGRTEQFVKAATSASALALFFFFLFVAFQHSAREGGLYIQQ